MSRKPEVPAPTEGGRISEPLVPSRRAGLETIRRALGSGPVLVTGEPGVGKSWLVERLAAAAPPRQDWVWLDLSPTLRPDDLARAIGFGLGLKPREGDRLVVAEALAESAADGRSCALVLDEAHLASDELLEEIRVLSNRLGRPDGFAALVLIGQTVLARRLRQRALAGLEARLAARVHLQPLDFEEACELLAGRSADLDFLDRLHLASGGNPRKLLTLAAPGEARATVVAPVRTAPTPEPAVVPVEPVPPAPHFRPPVPDAVARDEPAERRPRGRPPRRWSPRDRRWWTRKG